MGAVVAVQTAPKQIAQKSARPFGAVLVRRITVGRAVFAGGGSALAQVSEARERRLPPPYAARVPSVLRKMVPLRMAYYGRHNTKSDGNSLRFRRTFNQHLT